MPGFAGLQTNLLTWVIVAGMLVCWLISVRLVPNWSHEGWLSLLKSVYGFVWLAFGLNIVLRFLMLAYNAVQWGNSTPRLVAQPTDIVNATLAYCALFWMLLALAYALAGRRKGVGPLGVARAFTLDLAYVAAIPVAVLASVVFYFTEGQSRLPLALITPLVLLADLYMVPAVIIWWAHFRQPGPKWRIRSIHLLVLLPGLVRGWCSPYRENLAPILLIPLIAALFAGKRPTLRRVVPTGLVCLIVLSSLVSSYRRVKWENVRPEELVHEFGQAGFLDWVTGTWDEPMHRFHAFDSMLLTVALVPAIRPYSGRNVLVSPFLRGFIPRFVYSSKSDADAGINFGTQIWTFDDAQAREQSSAAIAPSMPGDLFSAGGVPYIALGALIWGTILGFVDGWKAHLPEFCGAAITVMVATQCAMSVERDFDNSVATFLQTFLVFVLVAGLIAVSRRGSTNFSPSLDPNLERS